MENQHRKISGYRELSQQEIDLMNEIKALGPQIEAVLKKVGNHVQKQTQACVTWDMEPIVHNQDELARLTEAEPERWTSIAQTNLQTGLMALTRAVAQPTFF